MKSHARLQYSICATLSFVLASSITSAAPTTTENFLEKIYADTKFNKTLETWDLSECDRQSTPLCVILYDVLLTLAAAKIPFTAEELQPQLDELQGDKFCGEFVAMVPQTSKIDATKASIEKFSDKKAQICKMCTVITVDLKEAVKPICGLIYLGYKKSAASPPAMSENVSAGGETVLREHVAAVPVAANISENIEKPKDVPPIPAQVVPEILPKPVEAAKNENVTVAPTPKKTESKEIKPVVDAEKPKEPNKQVAVNVTANEPAKPAQNDDEREEQNSININEVNNDDDPNAMMEEGADDEDADGTVDSGEDIPQDINAPVEPPPKPRQDSVSYANLDDAGPKVVQITDPFFEESESNFFGYFLFLMLMCIVAYVVYHNKSKILGLMLEGRRANGGRGGTRRKHTAAYRKLDSNLEEAITSNTIGEARTTQIIY